MNSTKTKRWIAALLVAMLTVLGLGQTMVYADENSGPEPHSTNVVLTKLESDAVPRDLTPEEIKDGISLGEDVKTIPNVSFNYYKINLNDLDKDGNLTGTLPTNPTGTVKTGTDGTVEFDLEEGVYWFEEVALGTIASSSAVPFSLILPYTNNAGNGWLETIHVYPKNVLQDVPGEDDIDKEVDESNVAIGAINEWTVTLNIPEGIEDYDKFTFYDDIDSRLDFIEGNNLDEVIVDASGLNRGSDYIVNYENRKLTVEFTESGREKLAGLENVTIKYKTKVNNTAIMGQNIENKATIDFDNGNGVTGKPESKDEVHTGGKAFIKMDGSSEALLEGAEFKIQNAQGQFVNVGNNGVVTFGGNGTIFTSDANGKFEIKGLPYGEYVLVETKAPNGYALPTNPNTDFTVDSTSYYQYPERVESHTRPSAKVQYINNRKLVIPQTGGIGTALFTVIGAAVMLFSVVFYRRTKEA